MKYTITRVLVLLLALVIMVSSVSCATSADHENPADGSQTEINKDGEETEYKPDLPKMDYKGEQFRILTSRSSYNRMIATTATGEVLNDAILEASHGVSNQFNVKFALIEGDGATIETFIMAGDDEYDVAFIHDCTTATLSLNGWFQDVNKLPYMDTTAPWWPQFIVESLTLNGKMYYFSNYSSYQAMAETRACFFNGQILKDYKTELPYDFVREGSWTLERLMQMSTDIYSDTNGDGKQDTEDLLGFASSHYPYAWLESFGIELYRKENPNSAELSVVNDDRCYTLIDKLHTWFYSGNDSVWAPMSDLGDESMTMFAEDHVAFTFACIGSQAPLAIEGGVDYGIVPFPKIDENQSQYYGGCTSPLFSVPVTIRDTERVGIILEAMAYEGYKHILPAYCENTLKTRFATDPDCAEMLNLIFDNQVISFAYLFANSVPEGIQFTFIANTVGKNQVASFFKSKKRPEERMLKTIMEFYD